jgi:general secretion pathway protein I
VITQAPSPKSRTGKGAVLGRARGFTLLELLVALAILSVGLTVLLAGLSLSLGRGRSDRAETSARAFAVSLLDQAIADPSAAVGETSGTSGGYAWHVSIEPYGDDDDQQAWHSRAAEVSVSVSWREPGKRREIALHSLRLIGEAGQ